MKKRIVVCLLAVVVWGCKEKETAVEPTVAETMKTYTIEQMMDNEAIRGGSFSPDKSRLLVSSNRSGI